MRILLANLDDAIEDILTKVKDGIEAARTNTGLICELPTKIDFQAEIVTQAGGVSTETTTAEDAKTNLRTDATVGGEQSVTETYAGNQSVVETFQGDNVVVEEYTGDQVVRETTDTDGETTEEHDGDQVVSEQSANDTHATPQHTIETTVSEPARTLTTSTTQTQSEGGGNTKRTTYDYI